jgi:DNA-binding NarL/FixJ family response regulator
MSGLRIWTSEDDALLRNLAASGESTTAIAKRLERSTAAVRKRAHKLEIRLAASQKGIGSRA